MKVLVVAPGYPSNTDPYAGAFIHEQVKAMKRTSPEISVDVVKVMPYSPKLLGMFNSRYSVYDTHRLGYDYESVSVNIIRVVTLPKNLNTASVCKSLYRRLSKFFRRGRQNYDIVHAHGAVHTGYATVRACSSLRAKSVVTVHGSDIMYYSELNKSMRQISGYILSNADLLIAASEVLKRSVNSKNPNSNVKQLYTGIDFSRFTTAHTHRRIESEERFRFIFVGNILESKGVFDLLEASRELRTRGYSCELSFCGTGNDLHRLMSKAQKLGLDNVSFLGAVGNDQLPQILAQHDVLVLPSHREGLGHVLIEALAVGRPVVGSNVGGIPEVISEGINGFLFTAGDVKDLVAAMVRSMVSFSTFDPEVLRKTVFDKFDIDTNAKTLVRTYRDLLSDQSEV